MDTVADERHAPPSTAAAAAAASRLFSVTAVAAALEFRRFKAHDTRATLTRTTIVAQAESAATSTTEGPEEVEAAGGGDTRDTVSSTDLDDAMLGSEMNEHIAG